MRTQFITSTHLAPESAVHRSPTLVASPAFAQSEPNQPVDWRASALCSQTDPEAFFPEKGESTRQAKKICHGCEVREPCLEAALARDERFGIWGGLSERERRRLRRLRRGGAASSWRAVSDGSEALAVRENE